MEDPAVWGGIWLATAAILGVGEMLSAGTFWLVPFAVAALPAAIVSFLGAPVLVGWLVFLIGAVLSFAAIRPLAKKLDIEVPNIPGIGANRLIGHEAIVTKAIPAGAEAFGMIKAGGELWNAESVNDMALAAGTEVQIVEVKGTRVVVTPAPASGLDRF